MTDKEIIEQIPYQMTKARWLYASHVQRNTKLRLFCIPYGGGGASLYVSWQKYMPNEIAVVPIQLPGRENRLNEKPIYNLQELVNALIKVLEGDLASPFAIYGHSFGALVAYRLAYQLYQSNLSTHLKLLFVGGFNAPTYVCNPFVVKAKEIMKKNGFEGIPIPDDIEHFTDEQIDRLCNLKEIGMNLNKLRTKIKDERMIRLILSEIFADLNVVGSYQRNFQEPLMNVPITAYCGKDDDRVSVEKMSGWKEFTTGQFDIQVLPGNHFFLHEDQSQRELINLIVRALNTT